MKKRKGRKRKVMKEIEKEDETKGRKGEEEMDGN
jgi:hypothetical protein